MRDSLAHEALHSLRYGEMNLKIDTLPNKDMLNLETQYSQSLESAMMKPTLLKDVFRFILELVESFKLNIGVMIFTAVLMALDVSLRPYLVKVILNKTAEVSGNEVYGAMIIPVLVYFSLSLFMSLASRIYNYFTEIQMVPKLREHITMRIVDHLLGHDLTYFHNHFSGTLANKISDLVGYVPGMIQLIIDRFFFNFLMLIIAIFALWSVSFKYALAMLIWVTLFVLLALFSSKYLSKQANKWSAIGSSITGKIVDLFSNFLSVKLFSNKNLEKSSLNKAIKYAIQTESKLQWMFLTMWLIYDFSFLILLGTSLYFLMVDSASGVVTIGDFALILGINMSVSTYLKELAQNFSQFSMLLGKITQALQLTNTPHRIVDGRDAKSISIKNGEIQFDKVTFNYPGSELLFKDKSLIIQAGKKVGLVGYSGCGKTTFVNLILRLHEVSSGQILIDGIPVNNITQDSLRRSIAMIPQDLTLFHRSLLENIRYGRSEASDEEVVEAAKKAFAHDFIEQLPQGYNTIVGERGLKLSGGQRQRIAIARALLKDAPILILDEATSQLDSTTEAQIQQSLYNLMDKKTAIVIAHRLSTLSFLDRILVFEKGKIVEDGTHEELLKKSGYYNHLWSLQIRGFLPDNKFQNGDFFKFDSSKV